MRAYGDIGGMDREKIAQYLDYCPRNRLIFIPSADPCLQTVDVGYELAALIKNDLESAHLPMIAEDSLKSVIRKSVHYDEIIGNYVAFTNWGILFEPDIKLNLLSLFDSLSKAQTLILVDCGQADCEKFHLVSRHFDITFPIGNLNPYIF